MDEPIKTMKLYSHFERVDNELQFKGKDATSKLVPADINPLDMMNYTGADGVRWAIDKCSLTAEKTVLDVGAGLGGPARLIAAEAGCKVTALELQLDCHAKAAEFTDRCGLSGLITHVQGDVMDTEDVAVQGLLNQTYDCCMSWLVFLHIPNKKLLMQQCAASLKPGGLLLFEDYFQKESFSDSDLASLHKDVYCSDLPTRTEYEEGTTQ
jgi:2-polyprenyl-3-methyl-5-hydroxy-6-metoxy-1,4-benzoquinol methylase